MEYIIKRFRWNTPIWYLMDLFNGSLIFCVKTYRNWSLTDFDQGSPSHSINSALSNLYSSIKKFRCLSRHSGGEKLKPRPFQISAESGRSLVSWKAENLNLFTRQFWAIHTTMQCRVKFWFIFWLKPSPFSHSNHTLLCEVSIGKSFVFFYTHSL